MSRRLSLTLLALLLIWHAPAQAQFSSAGGRAVRATLIADTDAIVPGKPFTAGVLLKMTPGWHVYWQYPGDSGLPVKIDWVLPPGFKAGPIQWPVPEKQLDEGDLQTYVYKEEVLLMVEITPPAKLDAKEIDITAKASWLVCEKTCVPGKDDVSLKLPVSAEGHAAKEAVFTKYRDMLPKTGAAGFTYKWGAKGDVATLDFHVPGAKPDQKFDFFPLPAEGMVLGHPAVKMAANGDGQATTPLTAGKPDQLSGVVMTGEGDSRTGWFVAPQTSAPAAGSATALPTTGLLMYLFYGFLGGMILNIMPCVLPVITLKIYGFMNQAGQSRGRILQLGLAYCAGVFAWFLALAGLIVIFGVNYSFQFQNRGFVGAMLVICLLFGLNLVGLFEVMLPSRLNTGIANLSSKEGLGGAFTHGLFATLMGSACTAPLLGPTIGFALSQPPAIIFALFATIAAGMSFPYFLLTLQPGWMRFLPKPGMWMVRVKQVMGVLMILTAAWFSYILYQQVAVTREPFQPQLEAALKSGRTVFVDFTAEWCINCKVNEKRVLNTAPVQDAFKKDDVLFLTADWTNSDPYITELLKQFGRAAVPAYVIYPAGSKENPIVLSEFLTTQIVMDGLDEARKKAGK